MDMDVPFDIDPSASVARLDGDAGTLAGDLGDNREVCLQFPGVVREDGGLLLKAGRVGGWKVRLS